MTITRLTSREFNQDTGSAKRAAMDGPVYITNRGEPSHVLLTFADFQCLSGNQITIIELLAQPPGVEDIDFHPPKASDTPQPADLD